MDEKISRRASRGANGRASGCAHRKPGEVVIWRVQKKVHRVTAPPMAAQMGYTCARGGERAGAGGARRRRG